MRAASADELWHWLLGSLAQEPMQAGVSLTLTDHRRGWLWNDKRQLSIVESFGDLLWLLSFNHDAGQANEYRPHPIGDSGAIDNAIGPTLRPQLASALALLQKARFSDGAVLSPWDGLESQHAAFFHSSVPFLRPSDLLSMQFVYAESRLNLVATYRDAEAWTLPSDIFAMSRLLSMVAGELNAQPGNTILNLNRVRIKSPRVAEAILSGAPQAGPPLLFDDSRGQRKGVGLMEACDDAAVVEELVRKRLDFKENSEDLLGFLPHSTLRGCLAAVYIHHAAKRLRFSPSLAESPSAGIQAVRLLVGEGLDRRLTNRALAESQVRFPATGNRPTRR